MLPHFTVDSVGGPAYSAGMATGDFTTGSESHPKPPPRPVPRESEAVEEAPPIIPQAAAASRRTAWKRWAVWVGSATAISLLAPGVKSWLAPAPESRGAERRTQTQVSTPSSPALAPQRLDPGAEAQPPAGAGQEPRPRPAADGRVMATCLLAVVDDFIVDVFQNWSGEPLWGTNRNTWIKFLARPLC